MGKKDSHNWCENYSQLNRDCKDNKDGQSCLRLANLLMNPKNDSHIQLRGLKKLQTGCEEAENPECCYFASQEYENIAENLEDEEVKCNILNSALKFLQHSCTFAKNDPNFCVMYGLKLISLKRYGEALPEFKKVCRHNSDSAACNLAAVLYENMENNLEKAHKYYSLSCNISGEPNTACYSATRVFSNVLSSQSQI